MQNPSLRAKTNETDGGGSTQVKLWIYKIHQLLKIPLSIIITLKFHKDCDAKNAVSELNGLSWGIFIAFQLYY